MVLTFGKFLPSILTPYKAFGFGDDNFDLIVTGSAKVANTSLTLEHTLGKYMVFGDVFSGVAFLTTFHCSSFWGLGRT